LLQDGIESAEELIGSKPRDRRRDSVIAGNETPLFGAHDGSHVSGGNEPVEGSSIAGQERGHSRPGPPTGNEQFDVVWESFTDARGHRRHGRFEASRKEDDPA
jgi:hypothetical protein